MRSKTSARFHALAGAFVLAAGVAACGKPTPAPDASPPRAGDGAAANAAAPSPAQTEVAAAEGSRPPIECGAATSADQCADILKRLGKDPAAAHGTPGNAPVYPAKLWEPPPCNNGAAKCEDWERMWPQ